MQEIVVSAILTILAVLLLNPFHFWMPDVAVMVMLAVLLVIFAIFAGLILKEKVFDERDAVNRSLAGRNAFLVGSSLLTLGIALETFEHSIDPWLVIGLVAMILVKIGTRLWSDKSL